MTGARFDPHTCLPCVYVTKAEAKTFGARVCDVGATIHGPGEKSHYDSSHRPRESAPVADSDGQGRAGQCRLDPSQLVDPMQAKRTPVSSIYRAGTVDAPKRTVHPQGNTAWSSERGPRFKKLQRLAGMWILDSTSPALTEAIAGRSVGLSVELVRARLLVRTDGRTDGRGRSVGLRGGGLCARDRSFFLSVAVVAQQAAAAAALMVDLV